jgi:hypothetical protein
MTCNHVENGVSYMHMDTCMKKKSFVIHLNCLFKNELLTSLHANETKQNEAIPSLSHMFSSRYLRNSSRVRIQHSLHGVCYTAEAMQKFTMSLITQA